MRDAVGYVGGGAAPARLWRAPRDIFGQKKHGSVGA